MKINHFDRFFKLLKVHMLRNNEMSINTSLQSKRDSIIRISKKYINAYKVSLSRFCKDGFGDGFE